MNVVEFLNNPVAAALLSKVNYGKKERVKVKADFLRMLLQLNLDPARMTLLHVFFDTYLNLNPVEEEKLQEIIKASPKEERIMELITIYEKRGMEKGLEQGREQGIRGLVLKLLGKQLGDLSSEIRETITTFELSKLEKVAEKILDIHNNKDLLTVIEQVKQD